MEQVDAQAAWRERRAPDGEMIMFGDGTLVLMETWHPVGSSEWDWREIVRARQWVSSRWMDVDGAATAVFDGYTALGGEGSWGGIGWAALTAPGDQLEWVAVSTYSNPFSSVALDATTLTATSTAGFTWRFPRDAPQDVRIVPT
ncbi:hypothetical protein [Spirillospora sp. CA-294931]|uniref:hypothetical protein n=1 Tax=Spirillospora sp. CA-294931 TaxID=3240042 RepID=UPI003D8B82D2